MDDNVIDISKFRKRKETDKLVNDMFVEAQKDDTIYTAIALTCAFEMAMILKDIDIDLEDEPATIKDIFIIVEAIKSLIYRIRGSSYPFQDISDTIIPLEDDKLLEILESFLYDDDPDFVS